MRKLRRVSVCLCLLLLSIAIVGCDSQTGSAHVVAPKTTPVVTPTTAPSVKSTPTLTSTATSVTLTQQTTNQVSGGGRTCQPEQFQGDLFTLTYPSCYPRQTVPVPGQPAGNHRFVYPSAPHSYLDVYEHNEDQDPGDMAAHTLSLTNAEMLQAGTNGKNITFTSATGIHWNGWDATITLSQPPVGFSSQYHIRILIYSVGAYQNIVIGILAPESSFATNYQTDFLPIIQSLALRTTGPLVQFQGDLFTLKYPEYFGEQLVPVDFQPQGNYRFVYPVAPHPYLDVYEHDEDQDPGEMAAHTLGLTNAEMLQAGTNDKPITFTSATGIHWTGWDTTITLSHQPVGFSSQYHIRILTHTNTNTHQKIVIGIMAPVSSFASLYQAKFLPIIQSLTLK